MVMVHAVRIPEHPEFTGIRADLPPNLDLDLVVSKALSNLEIAIAEYCGFVD